MRRLELKIPPGVFMLLTGSLMWLIARGAPYFHVVVPARRIVASVLFAAGVGVIALAIVAFQKARTTANPLKPHTASSLVFSGIYRYTRNPMYLGGLLVLMGWAVWLSNALVLPFLPGFVMYLNRFQIGPEERSLAIAFGSEFAEYRSKVRRWI